MALLPPESTLFLHPFASQHLRSNANPSPTCPLIISLTKCHNPLTLRLILIPFRPIREQSLDGIGVPLRDEAGHIGMVLSGNLLLGLTDASNFVLVTLIIHV